MGPKKKKMNTEQNSLSSALMNMPDPSFESNTQIRAIMTNYSKKRMLMKKSQVEITALPFSNS